MIELIKSGFLAVAQSPIINFSEGKVEIKRKMKKLSELYSDFKLLLIIKIFIILIIL